MHALSRMEAAIRRSGILPYVLAVAVVLLAAVATRLLWNVGDKAIFPLFFAAVVLAAWYGGFGPGLLATALSALVTAFVLLPPTKTFVAARDDILRLLVFTLVSVLTGSLHAAARIATEQERRARQSAEDAAAAKGRFLAMVSHELRTPLNPVIMIADSLEQEPSLSEEARQDLRILRRNVELEVRLIDDLLDLTRFTNGKLQLRLEPLDLRSPLRAAIAVLDQPMRQKKIDLRCEIPEAPLPVLGDALRLEQIFWNLLRNAVKFSPPGGQITIRAGLGAQGACVSITDAGIGIDPQRLSAIFRAFEQGGADISARFGGLGLGLAICRALTEAHHGAVTAASPGKGRGATFTVSLPAPRPESAPAKTAALPARSAIV